MKPPCYLCVYPASTFAPVDQFLQIWNECILLEVTDLEGSDISTTECRAIIIRKICVFFFFLMM